MRAVIRKDRLVLVQVKQARSGRVYLTLPGGRQEPGETMQACLARECLEEIGVVPVIGDVCHVADVRRVGPKGVRQLNEVLFSCTVPAAYQPVMGTAPDKRQIGTTWADPVEQGADFLPRYDLALLRADAPVYLGRLEHDAP
ncbi:MAG: NUDIX domain-containing protein [Marinibacterium sp.]|nr:NUDIX domain-containing protein [Marinibacterium sp.]